MRCQDCTSVMKRGFLYVRGFNPSMFWSEDKDVCYVSRSSLERIDLNELSLQPPRTQAILEAWQCMTCNTVSFKTS